MNAPTIDARLETGGKDDIRAGGIRLDLATGWRTDGVRPAVWIKWGAFSNGVHRDDLF